MAKLKDAPITQADIQEYLNGHSDFSFEMEVLRTLREMRLICQHSGTYVDPIKERVREFDIRAHGYRNRKRCYHFAVECKNVRENYPLVIHAVPRERAEAFHEYYSKNERGIDPSAAEIYTATGENTPYREHELVGKSMDQVGREAGAAAGVKASDGDVFEKMSQALASVDQLIKDVFAGKLKPRHPEGFWTNHAVVPVLVVPKGRLWMVGYDESGKVLVPPQQVDHCQYYVGREYKATQGVVHVSHMDIITISGLKPVLERYMHEEHDDGCLLNVAGLMHS